MTERLGLVQTWGDIQHTVSYELVIEGQAFGTFIALDGFGMDTFNYDVSDAVQMTDFVWRSGRRVPRRRTILPTQILQINADLLLPQGGTVWSVIDRYAGKNCPRNLFAIYPCPTLPEFSHFLRFRDMVIDEPQKTSKFVEQSEAPVPITAKATSHFQVEAKYIYQRAEVVNYTPDSLAGYAIRFVEPDCENCTDAENAKAVVVGETFSAYTESDWGETAPIDHPGASFVSGQIIYDVYVNGNFIIEVGTSTTPTPDTPLVRVSTDGGVSFTDTSPTATGLLAFYSVAKAGSYYYIGGTAGFIYRSTNGKIWTLVGNGGVTTGIFRSMDYDPVAQVLYVAGGNAIPSTAGVVLRIRGLSVTDISAYADPSTAQAEWHVIRVLEPGHVAVGGEDGIYNETHTANVVGDWEEGSVGDSAGIIRAIAGDAFRTFVGNDDALWHRDLLTKMTWEEMVVEGNFDGNYQDIECADKIRGVNHLVAVTDEGAIVRIFPTTPDSRN